MECSRQESMFSKTNEDLPLFSSTPVSASAPAFTPPVVARQEHMAVCPACLDTGIVDDKRCTCGAGGKVPLMVPVYHVCLVRDSSVCLNDLPRANGPADIATFLAHYMDGLDREILAVVLLDTKNHIIGINTVCMGTLDSTLCVPREVFKPAILTNAANIILAHNHPSGDPIPSPDDVQFTKTIAQAGDILSIKVLDHVIIGDHQHYSLKEHNLF